MNKPRYATLAELKTAYDSGVIPRDWELILDNDCSFLYAEVVTTNADGEEEVEDGEELFRGGMPERLLQEALTLLGIPWQEA